MRWKSRNFRKCLLPGPPIFDFFDFLWWFWTFTMRGIEWRLFHQNRPFSFRDIQGAESAPHPHQLKKSRKPTSNRVKGVIAWHNGRYAYKLFTFSNNLWRNRDKYRKTWLHYRNLIQTHRMLYHFTSEVRVQFRNSTSRPGHDLILPHCLPVSSALTWSWEYDLGDQSLSVLIE